jgi:two-component system response regulator FixJ
MAEQEPTVFVVDDDKAVRDSLTLFLASAGLAVEVFASADAFLAGYAPDRPGCLVLDIRMAGISGIELQEKLAAEGAILPIIFITGHANVPTAVRALKAGAVDFVEKPFNNQELLERIHRALERDARCRAVLDERGEILRRMARLTPREREVMDLVVEGCSNKMAADRLGISERTVEIHRARVMEKMESASLAHLVQMVVKARESSERNG